MHGSEEWVVTGDPGVEVVVVRGQVVSVQDGGSEGYIYVRKLN